MKLRNSSEKKIYFVEKAFLWRKKYIYLEKIRLRKTVLFEIKSLESGQYVDWLLKRMFAKLLTNSSMIKYDMKCVNWFEVLFALYNSNPFTNKIMKTERSCSSWHQMSLMCWKYKTKSIWYLYMSFTLIFNSHM